MKTDEDAVLSEKPTIQVDVGKDRVKVESEMKEDVIVSGHVILKRQRDVVQTDEKGRVVRRSFRNASFDMTKLV